MNVKGIKIKVSPQPFTGTSYYVSNAGSDAANGLSEGAAWATVSKVNSASFNNGDKVHFNKGGEWRETLIVPSNNIEILPYGTGANPVINASDVAAGWTSESSGGVNYLTTDTPLSYWMFEDSASPSLDATGNNNDFIWAGNTARTANHKQGAYGLSIGTGNASIQFANVSSNFPAKAATTGFTVGMWVKMKTTFSGFNTFLNFSDSSTKGFYFATNGANGVRFRIYGNNTRTVESDSSLNDGNWHHIVGRWDGVGTDLVTIWVDGVQQISAGFLSSINLVTASNLVVNQGDMSEIDELFVYDKALTDDDIKVIYRHGLAGDRDPVTHYYKSASENPTTVSFDGVLLGNVAAAAVMDTGTFWYDDPNDRVYLYDDPSGHSVELGARNNAILISGKSGVIIDSMVVKGGKGNTGLIRIMSATERVTIKDTEVYNCFSGISAPTSGGSNCIIQDCYIHDGYGYGIVANPNSGVGWIIKRCEIKEFGNLKADQTMGALHPQGIYADMDNLLIENNHIHHISTEDPNFKHAIYVENCLLTARGNYIHDCAAYGIKISTSSNDCQLYKNILIHNGAGIAIFGCLRANIYNNTIWGDDNESRGGWPGFGIYMESAYSVDSTITLLKNNIIGENYYFGATSNMVNTAASNTISNADYNLYYSSTTPSGNMFYYLGVLKTLAEWKALGFDSHAISANPLFIDSASDWHLQVGSPVIEAGVDVGLSYFGTAPNIGAY